MLRIWSKGDYTKTTKWLEKLIDQDIFSDFDHFGRMGVDALAMATPVDTGVTAGAWRYNLSTDPRNPSIEWYNTELVNGTPLVILLQYGHGTGTGGYVVGRDFINPAIQPIFDYIQDEVWKRLQP